jgi:tetratricopeptide (TPR) repeat protein
LLAETCALVHEGNSAAVLYRLLLPWAAFNVLAHPEVIRGSVSRYLGLLSSTLSRWEEAERHFEDGLEMNERMGARPWVAHTQHDYAAMLLARDEPGDREQASRLVREALATYRQLGMRDWADKADAIESRLS